MSMLAEMIASSALFGARHSTKKSYFAGVNKRFFKGLIRAASTSMLASWMRVYILICSGSETGNEYGADEVIAL